MGELGGDMVIIKSMPFGGSGGTDERWWRDVDGKARLERVSFGLGMREIPGMLES